jgi:23S rRNA (adenine2503-C2)-methyltransferase
MEKEKLFGKTLDELKVVASTAGLPKFAAKQLADWLYNKSIKSIDEMSNLSKAGRDKLNEIYDFGLIDSTRVQESTDGTKKYLFPTSHGQFIETAMIPDADRKTVCVSTQVGCKMGCEFCMTARQNFQDNLTPGEIINQIKNIPEWPAVTNIVYMGMGEPFDNTDNVLKSIKVLTSEWGFAMSPKRITVSTIGVISGITRFLEESACHLAISLHSPFDDERLKIMPVEKAYPIKEVLQIIREHDFGRQRRISFEYIMFKGVNDTPRHAKELVRILNGIKCRINLIRFHSIPDSELEGSNDNTIQEFKDLLNVKGITTTIRSSRGEDIFAACGLLSTKSLEK